MRDPSRGPHERVALLAQAQVIAANPQLEKGLRKLVTAGGWHAASRQDLEPQLSCPCTDHHYPAPCAALRVPESTSPKAHGSPEFDGVHMQNGYRCSKLQLQSRMHV